MEMNKELIQSIIRARLQRRIKDISFASHFGLKEIYIAGNSLNRMTPNDFDVFPVNAEDFLTAQNLENNISKTKNATTIKYNGHIIQFCNYHHHSLKDLVESFDFAHIKVGAKIVDNSVQDIYMSEDYITSQVTENSYYTGSSFPLSSLIRLFKYKERGNISGKQYVTETLKIVADIAQRGFVDYDDFKNQIDAVDLGLVPEDMQGCQDVLLKLFESLKRR